MVRKTADEDKLHRKYIFASKLRAIIMMNMEQASIFHTLLCSDWWMDGWRQSFFSDTTCYQNTVGNCRNFNRVQNNIHNSHVMLLVSAECGMD